MKGNHITYKCCKAETVESRDPQGEGRKKTKIGELILLN